MNPNEERDLLELALLAFGQVLDDQQNRMFSNGAVRPDRSPSDAFPNWVQWKLHFIAVAEANRWTDIQAINGMLVYENTNAEQRDEQFRDRFIEGLSNPDLLEVLLREDNRIFRETVERAVDVEAIAESIRNLPNKRVEAFRVAQEVTTTRNNLEVDEMKLQLKEMTSAMNSLTNRVNHFVGAVVSARRCDVCGGGRHFAQESYRQRMNPSNLRGPGGIAGISSPGRIIRYPFTIASRGHCESGRVKVS